MRRVLKRYRPPAVSGCPMRHSSSYRRGSRGIHRTPNGSERVGHEVSDGSVKEVDLLGRREAAAIYVSVSRVHDQLRVLQHGVPAKLWVPELVVAVAR